MQKITIGTVCFIRDRQQNKILLLERSRQPMAGLWTGVGGKTNFEEDINASCIREIKEETGLDVELVTLKGVIKTILDDATSSWILFVYVANEFSGQLMPCDEGTLLWVAEALLYDQNLIDFIRHILPTVLTDDAFVEGLIKHDVRGNVLEEKLVIKKQQK